MKYMIEIIILIIIIVMVIIYIYRLPLFCNVEMFSDVESIKLYNTPKFFNELHGIHHLDKRYGRPNLKIRHIQNSLVSLLHNFMYYCKINDIKPVLMYGGLIGYYFNGEMLPWDDDLDMILTEPYISRLKNYNSDDWLIEINPNSKEYSTYDVNNIISARVISKETGAFIDILFHAEIDNMLYCKDKNVYDKDDIYPLQKSKYYDIDIYLPNKIKECLIKRYGIRVLTPLSSEGWKFNNITKTWSEVIFENSEIDKSCRFKLE